MPNFTECLNVDNFAVRIQKCWRGYKVRKLQPKPKQVQKTESLELEENLNRCMDCGGIANCKFLEGISQTHDYVKRCLSCEKCYIDEEEFSKTFQELQEDADISFTADTWELNYDSDVKPLENEDFIDFEHDSRIMESQMNENQISVCKELIQEILLENFKIQKRREHIIFQKGLGEARSISLMEIKTLEQELRKAQKEIQKLSKSKKNNKSKL